jgi:chemotaxis protein histidine kinase CheA
LPGWKTCCRTSSWKRGSPVGRGQQAGGPGAGAQRQGLLNDIFRGFHTIKGGAGFLNATELVTLCHLTENLFDKLRNGELEITPR